MPIPKRKTRNTQRYVQQFVRTAKNKIKRITRNGWKYSKIKGKPVIGVVIGEDGDLFVGYEGGIPIRVREILDLYYKYSKRVGDYWYLEKVEILRNKRVRKKFKEMELEVQNL